MYFSDIFLFAPEPNEVTGANAGGAPLLWIRVLRAARIGQFIR
jgi:hypothetical protein